ncbi:MAG: hypothetical protein EWV41_03590 [Microcystis wesenbergii Mw_MB_S_20031200_S109]|uniref:Uncharacterized protein n=1 Tax=Microcystis wesenbergii Mw_MB_S_20031200_S109D TaxID=2486241 RepID=A0A552LTC0_9CHRO|nr:MAG: hypothetical protein EWV41_03590 [Microcystis wesenbergii Mw_MB_S_20031200_S109]TRV23469.1 MAG: hypothetical protein EWV88_11425 [Microcystis wesenbergii Mw_MB_S_20031200_S109D]
MNRFKSNQIVSLSCQNSQLYGEVIQVIESRSALWVRPLWLIVSDNFETIDVREGSDLILPMDLFKPALDTEVLPLFSQVVKDNYITNISYPLQEFVQKVCQNYPEYFQKIYD